MRHTFQLLLFCLLFPLQVFAAPSQADADKAYRQKDYAKALQAYEACLKQAEKTAGGNDELKAELYYNLGNCHYRLKNLGRAVLNYQRSLRLAPANEDAAFNLELTQAKLSDRFDAPAEMFFVSWAKSLVQSQSSSTWGLWGLLFIVVAAAFAALYLLATPIALRKTGFFGAIAATALVIACEGFAYMQHRRYEQLQLAVVLQTLDTYDTPTATAKKQRTLHEGTTVTIIETYKDGWFQVELPDGNEAWLKSQGIEKV